MSKILENYLSFVKNLIPQKGSSTAVGIDVGSDSCKLVELTRTAGALEVSRWGIEAVENGNSAAALKRLLEKNQIETKSPITAVSGKGTLIRFIELPRMSLEELKKSFAFEADKYLPFPQDQIFTDCFIIDPKGKEKKMSVLVAAAKKEIVNERLQILSQLGLQPNLITLNSLAIANVFHCIGSGLEDLSKVSSQEMNATATAVLDIGENVSSLMILKGNLPRFTRDIFIGGNEFNKRISNLLGLNLTDAKKFKIESKGKTEELYSACESVLNNLLSEIRLSFDYFITEKNTPVSKVLLTGGNSLLEGIKDYFSKSLDMPVETWNPLGSIKFAADVSESEVKNNANRLGVALGLALYYE